ncbi:MAG: hypothetical protein ACT4OX_03945 [Actinomycetota bacterium]
MDDRTVRDDRLARRGRSIRTTAASVAAVPILLLLFALADSPPGNAPAIRVHSFSAEASARAARGQTFATAPTAPPTTAPAPPALEPVNVRRVPGPPADVPVVAGAIVPAVAVDPPPPPPIPPFALTLDGAFALDPGQIKGRHYPVAAGNAPHIVWSIEAAANVTLTGPGVATTARSGDIVPCPGELNIERQRCKPERGNHVYTLTATDEYGRSVTGTLTLSIGVEYWPETA